MLRHVSVLSEVGVFNMFFWIEIDDFGSASLRIGAPSTPAGNNLNNSFLVFERRQPGDQFTNSHFFSESRKVGS
jgi:hypothetical protein